MRLGRFRWNSERFFAKSRLEVEKRESRESQIFTEAWKPNKGEPSVKTDVYQSHVSTRRFSIERGTEEDSSGSRGYLGNFSNRRNPREPLQRSGIGIPPTIVRSLLRSTSLSSFSPLSRVISKLPVQRRRRCASHETKIARNGSEKSEGEKKKRMVRRKPVVRQGTKIFVEIILGHPSFPRFPSSCFFPDPHIRLEPRALEYLYNDAGYFHSVEK